MSVLVLAEIVDGALALGTTAKVVSAVKPLGDVKILCCGSNAEAAANKAATIDGVAEVLLADDALYDHSLAEPLAALVASKGSDFTHIAAAATTGAKNMLPRLAALLDVMVLTDVVAVLDCDTFERPVYAGNAIQTVKSNDPVKVFTVRASSFEAASTGNGASVVKIDGAGDPGLSEWLEDVSTKSDRPELTTAGVVISGGRGVGSQEDFKLIEQLADVVGGAVGASRAAVDAGYAPNDYQVGQTGKIVAPELYVAVGISGAIQHLAGMKDSKVIVAINKDEEAPIFQIADFGLVGDLFDVVPELTRKLLQ